LKLQLHDQFMNQWLTHYFSTLVDFFYLCR